MRLLAAATTLSVWQALLFAFIGGLNPEPHAMCAADPVDEDIGPRE